MPGTEDVRKLAAVVDKTCRRWTRPTVDSAERSPLDLTPRVWLAMLTWRAQDISRMESTSPVVRRGLANGQVAAARE